MSKIYQKTLPAEKNAGFTLIELLVVVLIIGILSAVALPQYTKAVEKARLSEGVSMLGQLEKAVSVYMLANGGASSGQSVNIIEDLDISLSHLKSPDGTPASRLCSNTFCYVVTCGHNSCSMEAARLQDGVPGSGPPIYYLQNYVYNDGSVSKLYSVCTWSGGDIFADLRAQGYTEIGC